MAAGPEPTNGSMSVWRLFGFLLGVHRDAFYGYTHIRWQAGRPMMVRVEDERLVESLTGPTSEQIADLMKGVG